MHATISVLAERGYHGLTTALVAQQAGVSTASLYRRWDTKNDLLVAATMSVQQKVTPTVDTGSLASDLSELLEHKIELLAGPIGTVLRSLVGASSHDETLARALEASFYDEMITCVHQIIARAVSRREISRDVDSVALAEVVIGILCVPLLLRTDTEHLASRISIDMSVRMIIGAAMNMCDSSIRC